MNIVFLKICCVYVEEYASVLMVRLFFFCCVFMAQGVAGLFRQ